MCIWEEYSVYSDPAKGTSVRHVVVRKGEKGDVEKFKEVYVDTLGRMQCESLLGNHSNTFL
jgi:hypothetical protein